MIMIIREILIKITTKIREKKNLFKFTLEL